MTVFCARVFLLLELDAYEHTVVVVEELADGGEG